MIPITVVLPNNVQKRAIGLNIQKHLTDFGVRYYIYAHLSKHTRLVVSKPFFTEEAALEMKAAIIEEGICYADSYYLKGIDKVVKVLPYPAKSFCRDECEMWSSIQNNCMLPIHEKKQCKAYKFHVYCVDKGYMKEE